MSATTRVAAAVAAGYLLGRTKKARLAITVGSVLAGGRLAGGVKPGALIQMLSDNPEVKRLQEQLRGQVLEAAKAAAANVATSKLEALNESLQGGKSLTESLTGEGGEPEGPEQDAGAEEQGGQDQGGQDQGGQEEQPEQEEAADQAEPEQEASEQEPQRKRAAKKAPARKRTQGGGEGGGEGGRQGGQQGGQRSSQRASGAAKRAPRKKAAASGEGR